MEETKFLGFGQQSRPDIGLIADGVQNLAEIFDSDKDTALENIGLNPSVLDIIYKLSDVISREDLRSASDLSSLLLPTLDMQDEVFNELIPNLFDVSQTYSSSRYQLGIDSQNPSLDGSQVIAPHTIIYNGSIQCQGVEYKTNMIGERLFTNPDRKLTSISTSRASLFNAEGYPATSPNVGFFKSASLAASVRVRRRSRVNKIIVPKTTFIPRAAVTENPSHSILCNIGAPDGTNNAVKLIATKNSPIRLFCRMSTGQINFTFTEPGIFFLGYQVQPAQARVVGETPGFLALPPALQQTASDSFTLDIDITKTGFQNVYDLNLYLYVNVEKIKSISISGIDVKDFIDGKDIGFIGFNNLESLSLKGTSIKILPIWLKTLGLKLKVLDLESAGDSFRNGPLKWFDYRDSEIPNTGYSFANFPLYTAVGYLTIPKKGAMIKEDGTDWSDDRFKKYVKNQTRVAVTDYRVFSAFKTLKLGDRFMGKNPRFDDVFPNLTTLSWVGSYGTAGGDRIEGKPPKINNNGEIIAYNINGSGAAGSIEDIGTSTTSADLGHISKYKFESINLSGRYGRSANITGSIAESGDWGNWFSTTRSIDISFTGAYITLQPADSWTVLASCTVAYSGGVKFTATSTPLKTPVLTSLSIYATSSTGQLPSLGTEANTRELGAVEFGGAGLISTISYEGYQFILPLGFAPDRPSIYHKLKSFGFADSPLSGRLRLKDFKNLYSLESISFVRSPNVRSKFPQVPTTRLPETEKKAIKIYIQENCGFYDLTSLSIIPSNKYFARDIRVIEAWNNNSERRGCKLPSLDGVSDTEIETINLNNCLASQYPSFWYDPGKHSKYIRNEDPYSSADATPGAKMFTTGGDGNWDEEDNIYFLEGTDLHTKVLPGDSVRSAIGGPELAFVLDVTASKVIVSKKIEGSSLSQFYFYRKNQSIDSWFEQGFSNIKSLRLNNCRLVGSINIRSGFGKIVDDSYAALDLSNNLISGYTEGFAKIFSGDTRKITIDLSLNNFSTGAVRKMLTELIEIDQVGKFSNVVVRINNCKFNPTTGGYEEYTQEELFPSTIESMSGQTITLFRNETLKLYKTVSKLDSEGKPTFNSDGTPITEKIQSGTKLISVPGQFIASLSPTPAYNNAGGDATVYTNQVSGRQRIVENFLASKYKNLKSFKINLGFVYQVPNTTPVTVSTTYTNSVTRRGSVESAGYNWADILV